MPKASNTSDEASDADEFDAKLARVELQARYYEAQIRVLEARRKLAALRKAIKAES